VVEVSAAAEAHHPRLPRSRPSRASAAWWAVAVLPPARVPVLAASLWPLLVLVPVLAASLSKRPRVPVQALAVALTPPALALQRAGVLMPRALVLPLAFAPTRALGLLPGPCYVCTAGPVLGSTIWLRPTTGRVLTLPSRSPAPQGRPHTQARREIRAIVS